MKPEQKAKELVDKYFSEMQFSEFVNDLDASKQCAKITVDEIIESIEFGLINHPDSKYLIEKLNFYDSVKQEINKL